MNVMEDKKVVLTTEQVSGNTCIVLTRVGNHTAFLQLGKDIQLI